MRWVRDVALLIVLTAACLGVVYYQMDRTEASETIEKTMIDGQRLEREVRFRAATKAVELNARGWPVTIDPEWFSGDAPVNRLVSDEHPWVEVAGPDQAGLTHPPVRIAVDNSVAGFWYNPFQGIVRARVPVSVSDEQTTAVYNAVNQSSIPSIHWAEKPAPIPNPTGAKQADEHAAEGDHPEGSKASSDASEQPRKPVQTVIVKRTKPGKSAR